MTAEVRHKGSENLLWSLVAGPIMGLLYVIALPFIAIGTVLAMLGKKAGESFYQLAANLVSFGWRPLEAHFAGKRKERKRKDNSRKD